MRGPWPQEEWGPLLPESNRGLGISRDNGLSLCEKSGDSFLLGEVENLSWSSLVTAPPTVPRPAGLGRPVTTMFGLLVIRSWSAREMPGASEENAQKKTGKKNQNNLFDVVDTFQPWGNQPARILPRTAFGEDTSGYYASAACKQQGRLILLLALKGVSKSCSKITPPPPPSLPRPSTVGINQCCKPQHDDLQ